MLNTLKKIYKKVRYNVGFDVVVFLHIQAYYSVVRTGGNV